MQPERRERILSKLGPIADLPALPRSVVELLRLLEKNAGLSEIAALLARDVAVATRVMRVANSSLYSAQGEVESLSRACGVIGIEGVRDIALSIGVIHTVRAPDLPGLDVKDFWVHALTSAIAAGKIVRMSSGGRDAASQSEAAFVCALLHDVGVPVLARQLPEAYAEVLQKNAALGEPLFATERALLGTTHAEVGAAVLSHWGLPARVVAAAEFHHEPARAPQALHDAVNVVHLADWITHHLGHGSAVDGAIGPFHDPVWDALGLHAEAIPEIMESFDEAAGRGRTLAALVN